MIHVNVQSAVYNAHTVSFSGFIVSMSRDCFRETSLAAGDRPAYFFMRILNGYCLIRIPIWTSQVFTYLYPTSVVGGI